MQRRPVRFSSDRLLLDGDLWLPDEVRPGQRLPAVVSASGYQGLKNIHPERFARTLVPEGFACLSFDYRGFGASEGERGRLVPQEWVADVRAAVSFMESVAEVDTDRIVLLGWALGGGVVIAEAADDPRVRAVASCNAIADGYRSTQQMHSEQEWEQLLARIAADRPHAAVTGRSEIVHPFDIVALDRVTKGYVDDELYKAAGFGSGVTLESADYLLRFRPEDVVHRIAPRPLLLAHGDRNELHSPEESRRLAELAGDNAELMLLPDSGHTEWMYDEHPTYQSMMKRIADFFRGALGA
ncbi:MAG: alpha/beta fold hydrolase [Actinomycetota bacterium]|nr:alpha/beta fold hydrolase [Actinomycetota bacterium]